MRIRILALGFVWVASLYGQHRFRWQDYCFNNPGAPVCRGHEYAIKKPGTAKDPAPRNAAKNPFPPRPEKLRPSIITIGGGIDWRFADPLADAVIGINFSGLSASPLAHSLISQLGTWQGFSEADMQKIFDGLSGVDHAALSIRDNRIVVMITGPVTDSPFPTPPAGFAVVKVTGSSILAGHADAVDQAFQRIAMKGPPADLTRLAEERQANSEFWAIGSAALAGPQAVSAGVKLFSMTVSIRDRLTSDVSFEFNGALGADAQRQWQTSLGAATVEGNVVHLRTSMEAGEVEQKFGPIAASPLGQRLAALVDAARYLPVRDTAAPKQTKPMIYGLDGGPKEVNQLSSH